MSSKIRLTDKRWRSELSGKMLANVRLASIDIGSNAIRLFVGQNTKSGRVKVLEDCRASVRLGKDAFTNGYIRPHTINELEKVLLYFSELCEHLHVQRIQAVGTSALRDSSNGKRVVQKMQDKTGIKVNLINGNREANLLFRAVAHSVDLRNKNAILMDMGGGSLEIVTSKNGRATGLQSLPLGTVRLLSKMKGHADYEDYAKWVRMPLYRLHAQIANRTSTQNELLVGTGGNLRALGKLCERLSLSRSRTRFTRAHLEILTRRLFRMTLNQRMKRFQLRRDRADVILPAAVVTLELMRIFDLENIVVPNVGIKNGLFWEGLEKYGRTRR